MKTQLIHTAIAVLTLAAAGYAQTERPLQVDVPFDFVAGSSTLPAGQYAVTQPVNTSAIALRPIGNPRGAIMLANRLVSPGKRQIARLVFHRYGYRYFLAEVWGSDGSTGSQIPVTVQERNLAQHSRPVLASIFVAAH